MDQFIRNLRMNGGTGETSYSSNSSVQKKALCITRPMIEEAALDVFSKFYACSTTSSRTEMMAKSIGIADLGCSSGPNTLLVISYLFNVIYNKCREFDSVSPEIVMFLNDLPGNDFNTLFKYLESFCDELKRTKGDCFESLRSHVTSDNNWSIILKRRLHNLEADQLALLLHQIGNTPPCMDNIRDTRRWSLTEDGIFTVKSLYGKLNEEAGTPNFPSAFIWNGIIPPKINFLIWCAVHGRLNTADRLLRKSIECNQTCSMCGNAAETANHLFLHCKVAYKVWHMLLPPNWNWSFPNSIYDLAHCWHASNLSSSGKVVWPLIPAAIVWTLWCERNARIYEAKHYFKTDEDLGTAAKALVLAWATAHGKRVHLNFSSSILDWDTTFA